MSIFKEESETKRMIFNVRMDLAERLETAKEDAKELGRKLDMDTAINEALEKFLKKAEKRLAELLGKREEFRSMRITTGDDADDADAGDTDDETEPQDMKPDQPTGQAQAPEQTAAEGKADTTKPAAKAAPRPAKGKAKS